MYMDSLSVPHQSSDDDDDEIPRAPGHRSGHSEQVRTSNSPLMTKTFAGLDQPFKASRMVR